MDKSYNLSMIFETSSGKDHRWTLNGVRSDIAAVYRPLVEDIIAMNVYDAGTKGDLTALTKAELIEITVNNLSIY